MVQMQYMHLSKYHLPTTCWNREFELLYTTKREIEFQEIQKYHWNAQKIPDIMVKCFSSGGHFAASEAVK